MKSCCVLLLLLFSSLPVFAQSWTTKLDEDIRFYQPTEMGVLVAGTVLSWQRRTRGACANCGRSDEPQTAAPRWDRLAVGVAIAVPLLYAVTRFAWLLGIPLGIDAAMLRDLHDSGGVWAGAGLAAFAVVGAVLTLGLVQQWGAVFPRWLPILRGRRVPIRLAVVPATLVSLAVTSAGLGTLAGAGELLDGFAAEPCGS